MNRAFSCDHYLQDYEGEQKTAAMLVYNEISLVPRPHGRREFPGYEATKR